MFMAVEDQKHEAESIKWLLSSAQFATQQL